MAAIRTSSVRYRGGFDSDPGGRRMGSLPMSMKHPVTSVGRYFVVRGRLWRLASPDLASAHKGELVSELMAARCAVKQAKPTITRTQRPPRTRRLIKQNGHWESAGPSVGRTGTGFNRHLVKNTPYASWYAGMQRGDADWGGSRP